MTASAAWTRGVLVRLVASATLAGALGPGCHLSHERDPGRPDATAPPVDASRPSDAGVDAGTPRDAARATPRLVWVLVHPSRAPAGPGLFLFDEANQETVRRLPLPPGATSPHALAWDGASLFLGGVDRDPAVRELDPEDGRVLATWPGVTTEGIATEDGRYWYVQLAGALQPLVEVTREGSEVATHLLPEATTQDLVAADGALFYLVNDGVDRIMRADPATGATRELTRGVHVAPYSLGFDGTHLVVAVDGIARRFDPVTGELVRESAFGVPGWITAIAYVR